MANAIKARQLGDNYQKIFFWIKACEMLERYSNIATVSYEDQELKSFDDVVVRYKKPIRDPKGYQVNKEYYQIKYHVDYRDNITLDNLMDPKFINASNESLLQKIKKASLSLNEGEDFGVAKFLTTWRIHSDDDLAKSKLIDAEDGSFKLEVLFDGKHQSNMSKIRSKLKNHLEIENDKDLENVLKVFRLCEGYLTYEALIKFLNSKLPSVGLLPIDTTKRDNRYISLIERLFQEGNTIHNKEELIQICKSEGLWTGTNLMSPEEIPIGIRSFMRRAENLENETSKMLCLVDHFNGRYLKEDFGWNKDIKRKINDFLVQYLHEGQSYCIHLDAHSSMAFTAGHYLDPKSAIKAVPIQKSLEGREIWRSEPTVPKEHYPLWEIAHEDIDENGEDIVIVIEMTHSALAEVKHYISTNDVSTKTIIRFYLQEGPGFDSIHDGVHARYLANEISKNLNTLSFEDRKKPFRLFGAGPNAFWFILGQFSKSFGQIILHEHDFEVTKEYKETISLP